MICWRCWTRAHAGRSPQLGSKNRPLKITQCLNGSFILLLPHGRINTYGIIEDKNSSYLSHFVKTGGSHFFTHVFMFETPRCQRSSNGRPSPLGSCRQERNLSQTCWISSLVCLQSLHQKLYKVHSRLLILPFYCQYGSEEQIYYSREPRIMSKAKFLAPGG